MNARFWIYSDNGNWIKITLAKGETLTLHCGGRTDEGYSYRATSYTNAEGGVFRQTTTTASDCDGRIDSAREDFCPYTDLHGIDAYEYYPCWENEGIFRPKWEKVKSSQYDYSAAAMGY